MASQKLGLFTLTGFIIVVTQASVYWFFFFIIRHGLFVKNHSTFLLLQIFCEVSKQTAFYSLQYYNNGVFPIPKTFLVVLTEVTKLVTIVALSKGQCPISKYGLSSRELRNSAKYLLPSVFYGVNNNLYLLGLTMVAPPIFNILISVRTVITACVYKVCHIRSLKMTQLSSSVLFFYSSS